MKWLHGIFVVWCAVLAVALMFTAGMVAAWLALALGAVH